MANAEHAIREEELRGIAGTFAGGSLVESIGGAAAVVLSILGLAGLSPTFLMAIAAIAVGAGLLFEGGAIASRYTKLLHQLGGESMAEVGSGLTAEFMGGAAGAVLGILGVLRVMPMTLLPIAAIVFGAALIVGTGATSQLTRVSVPKLGEAGREVLQQTVRAAAGVQTLVGLAAVALGIIALVGIGEPVVLTLVAFLALGSSILFSGGAIAGRMLSLFQY